MKFGTRRVVLWFKLFDFRKNRATFYRDLAEMYRRGESMLAFLEGELTNAKLTRETSRAAALRIILSRYDSGAERGRLGYLLEGIMPANDNMMIAGVERAANKSDALFALVRAVEQADAMKQTIRAACVVPVIVFAVCIPLIQTVSVVLNHINKDVPPEIYDQVWGGFNGLAKAIADFCLAYGGPALGIFLAAIALVVWSLPRWTGPGRLKADRLPVYSLYRDLQSGLLFSSMAMLLKTGGSLRGTIEDLAQRASPVTRWQLSRVLRSLDDAPTQTIEAFSRGILSPFLLARSATLYRTTNSFTDVLIELGTTEGDRVLASVKRAAISANVAVLLVLVTLGSILSLAAMTVPAAFSNAMEPSNLMAAKMTYQHTQRPGAAKPQISNR